jgi:hypothetical protein
MDGKLGKYSWTVDPKGWITVWVGTKEHYKTPYDGSVSFDPEEVILHIITSNEEFEKQGNELLKLFTVCSDPCPENLSRWI